MSLDSQLPLSSDEELGFMYDVPVEMTVESNARFGKFLYLGVVLGEASLYLGRTVRNEVTPFPESVADYSVAGLAGLGVGFLLGVGYEIWRGEPQHD